MTRTATLAACLALAVPLALGCVTSITEEDVERDLERTVAELPKLGRARVIPVYAETRLVAKALLYEARHDVDSELSLMLSRRMAAAARRRVNVVVGGPYDSLTAQVLENAFELNEKKGLYGMKVVLVSGDKPSDDLARAATQARARLYHRAPR